MIIAAIYILCCRVVFATMYDYIVVGSGSAGSVVANRLSENPTIQVLLLEAGGFPNLASEVPLFSEMESMSFNWNYATVPLKHAGFGLVNRVSPVRRGKVLGGCSSVNGNVYLRGNKYDYDRWAANGAVGWDWEGVLLHFKKLEDYGDPDLATNGYHSSGGDQPVNYSPFRTPLAEAYLDAARSLGYVIDDYHGKNETVFNFIQGTIKNGRKWSGLKSFIEPIKGRRNIKILTFSHVTKILISSNKRAYGVQYDRDNRTYQAIAKEEVILCAGAFNSPQLLMLSGIGPKEELRKLQIPVISNLPVGRNLQNHVLTTALLFHTNVPVIRNQMLASKEYYAYLNSGTGPLSTIGGLEVVGFIKSKYESSNFPDIEIIWMSKNEQEEGFKTFLNADDELWNAFEPYANTDTVTCYAIPLLPKSIGKMWLTSTDPYHPPSIDPNYFSHPYDMKILVEGMKFCLQMAAQEPLKRKGVRPVLIDIPGCENHQRFSDEHLECIAKVATRAIDHHLGTCKMGAPNDPTAVVDPKLRVKGVRSLRVVDSSIMPIIISGHTDGPSAMVGEKGAAIILEDLRQRRGSNIFTCTKKAIAKCFS